MYLQMFRLLEHTTVKTSLKLASKAELHVPRLCRQYLLMILPIVPKT
jgi:hypothetical protein